MTVPADRYIACVWRSYPDNRVIERRPFKTYEGAIRFLERTSETSGVSEVALTGPSKRAGAYGEKLGVARNGLFIPHDKENTMANHATKTTTKKATRKRAAAKPATKTAPSKTTPAKKALPLQGKGVGITSWLDVLALPDGKLSRAYPLKTPLAFPGADEHTVLAASKSNAETVRYDRAYLRFLSGAVGSCPSNPASTGIEDTNVRAARRTAIRAALAKLDTQDAKTRAAVAAKKRGRSKRIRVS